VTLLLQRDQRGRDSRSPGRDQNQLTWESGIPARAIRILQMT
jgi:hypothetical protein